MIDDLASWVEESRPVSGESSVGVGGDGDKIIKICKHVCEKKKRRCKFNAIRNSDYCVEHLAFNEQV